MNGVRDILEAIRALPRPDRLRLAEQLSEELGSEPLQGPPVEAPSGSRLVLKNGFHVFTGSVEQAPDARVVFISGLLQGEHGDGVEHTFHGFGKPLGATQRGSKTKLTGDHDASANSVVANLGEMPGADAGRLLHESGDDVGVEQTRQ